MKTIQYAKVKGERNGRCKICGEMRSLTWDHVPPRGGIEVSPVEIRSIFQVITGQTEGFDIVQSQNGVKYRTICKACNERMGALYDPVINDFAITVGRYLNTVLKLPKITSHPTKPGALIRGLLGHLLACKVNVNDSVFDLNVRPIIFDLAKPIPESIHVYYWIHPYAVTLTMRDFAITSLNDPLKRVSFCHTLRYFPVAYLVTDSADYEGLQDLTAYQGTTVDEVVSIPICLTETKPVFWPAGEEMNVVFGGEALKSSAVAFPRKQR